MRFAVSAPTSGMRSVRDSRPDPSFRLHACGAALCGLALRLVFIWQFPYHDSGDTPIYEELARSWLHQGVYGIVVAGELQPVDIRMPGYPAFLAAVYRLFGESPSAVMAVQAFADLAACACVAALAAAIAPAASRARVAIAALWLAALCPFTANYTATVLSETLAIDLTALVLLVLVAIAARPSRFACFAAGVVAGLGAHVRPETPLVLIAAAPVWLARWREQRHTLVRFAVFGALGLTLVLAPWAIRNALTLHEVRLLAPRYSELPSETAPRGFFAWTFTWLWRFDDVETVSWKVDTDEIAIDDVPPEAFDSPAERERVARLLEQYNETQKTTPAVDTEFAAIAAERTRRDPLRSYVTIPLRRVWTLWMTPRVEMLPAAEFLSPIGAAWEHDPLGFCLIVGCVVINAAYLALALVGVRYAIGKAAGVLLVSFVVVRTAFLAVGALAPEPRYTLECFPAIIALAAQLWA